MEFEEKAKTASDDERRLAESKKITIQPMHLHVEPEDVPDSIIASQHMNGRPIANIHSDVEQEAEALLPSKEILESSASARSDHAAAKTKGIIIAAIIVAATIIVGYITLIIRV